MPRNCSRVTREIGLLPIQLALMIVVSIITSLLLFLLLIPLLGLYLIQRGFNVTLSNRYATGENGRNICTLKIVHPDIDGLYLHDRLAEQIWDLVKEHAQTNHARGHCMLSSQTLGDEYAKWVGHDPAQVFFFKVLYGYVSPLVRANSPLHYHGVICLTRFEGDGLALKVLKKRLVDLGLRFDEHESVYDVQIRTKGTDMCETAVLWFGSTTFWDPSTAQKLFDFETVYLVSVFHRFRNRVCYWTNYAPSNNVHDDLDMNSQRSITWLSYESHGSLEEMTYKRWSAKLRFPQMLALYISGFTNLAYAGVEPNSSLAESTVTIAQLYQMAGPFMTVLLKSYSYFFANFQGSSTNTMVYFSKIFDYREPFQISRDSPPRLKENTIWNESLS
jgi:hypothetical protein